MTKQETQNSMTTPQELGAKLRQHREKKGLSVGEVSERLKLPARQIDALENGEYVNLPEPVFVRGFLRSYGRFLDVEEETLNAALSHISPQDKVQHAGQSKFNLGNDATPKKSFPFWIVGLLLAAGLGYGVYMWQAKSQQEHEKQEAETSVLSASSVATASVPSLNTSNVIVKPMTASDMQIVTASSVVQSASAPVAAIAGELVINARYRTMLTVTNAQGEVLINQIVPARSEHRFSNGAPFEVRLGYASGTTVTFNGESFNVEAAKRGKSATFTVGDKPLNSVASVPQ
ncbi:helix-turn-helix domain-containing protein [Kingella kingae]|uniref:helix-turn-helix domain-containing protein n=1 Tax=Kingella kingae TaxID=504 RepID=UPI00254A117F|nr:helix-turn-helix domain-containing protein [Kingella kingae]MDK4529394.1 DUF4115 domain-containing protein [Kingella kingae]